MIKALTFLIFLNCSLSWAKDTTGVCNDCTNVLPKSAQMNKLAAEVENFDPKFSVVEAKKSMLHWKCDPYKRELFLTDKSEKIDPKFSVQRYMYIDDCVKDEMRLNESPSIVQDINGKRTVHQIIVCVHNNYYLVNQDMPLEDLTTKGLKLNPKYLMSENKCVDVPGDFSSVGTFNGIKLMFDDERYKTFNKNMIENHNKVLKKNFN